MVRLVLTRLVGFISLCAAWPLLEDLFSQSELPITPVFLLLGALLLGLFQPAVAQAQTAPAAPKSLVAKPSSSSVALTWAASSGATSYKVFRSTTSNIYSTPLSSPTTLAYTDSTAVNNTTYYYVVKASKTGVDSVNSAQVSARPKAPPTPVTLNNPTATIVNGAPSAALAWTKNTESNFGSYKIYRGPSSGVTPQNGTLVTTITNANTLAYTDSSVVVAPTPGTTFYYMVAVTDSIAQVSPSVEKSITLVNTASAPDAVTLNDPTAGYDDTSIELSWSQSNEPYFASYKIYRRTSPGVTPQNGTLIGTQTSRNATYFYDSGLTPGVAPGTTYYYIVVVTNNANLSTSSSEKSLPLINAPPSAVTLDTPYGDDYYGEGDNDYSNPNGAQLSWTQSNESDFASYKIYRRTSPGVTPQNGTLVDTITTRNENWSYDNGAVATVAPGITYYYIAVVTDAAGQTAASNETSILRLNKVPSAVTLATPTTYEWEYADESVQLSWSQSYKWDFASYKIYRGTAPGVTPQNGTLVTTITQGNQTYYSDSTAPRTSPPGTTYYYIVVVTDAAGQTAISAEKSIFRLNSIPQAVTFDAQIGSDEDGNGWGNNTPFTQLTWTRSDEDDFSSYKIYRGTSATVTSQDGTLITTETNSNGLTYSDWTVEPTVGMGTTYYYILVVSDSLGQTWTSPAKSVIFVDTPPVTSVLDAPVKADQEWGGNGVMLSWTRNNEYDFKEYRLYRSNRPNVSKNDTLLTTVTPGYYYGEKITYQDYTTQPAPGLGRTYYYKVYAFDNVGQSTPSNEGSITLTSDNVPGKPGVPRVTAVTVDGASVVMPDPNLPARTASLTLQLTVANQRYPYWASVAGGTELAPGAQITLSGLSAGTPYLLRAVAVGAGGGTFSDEVGFTTGSTAPALYGAPTFTDGTSSGVSVIVPTLQNDTNWLNLQIKFAGQPDSSFSTYADRLGYDDYGYYENGNNLKRVEPLSTGVTYSFRFIAVGEGGSTVCPSVDFSVPTESATWASGGSILCGGIAWPISMGTIAHGTEGHLNAYLATDWDYRQVTSNGQITSEWYSDPCSYTWAVLNSSGQPVGNFRDNRNTGQAPVWIAPQTPGTYTVALLVDDQNAANQPNLEAGSRHDPTQGFNDDPVKFSATITVF